MYVTEELNFFYTGVLTQIRESALLSVQFHNFSYIRKVVQTTTSTSRTFHHSPQRNLNPTEQVAPPPSPHPHEPRDRGTFIMGAQESRKVLTQGKRPWGTAEAVKGRGRRGQHLGRMGRTRGR